MLIPQEVIFKKRSGLKLGAKEIHGFFSSYLAGEVADYQVSALMMSVFFQGMDFEETASLTKTSRDSGFCFQWGAEEGFFVDKHSTGGVGDKTSLILVPLCLLEDMKVPMIAGRGLGHTGGTLDKLESIPGMKVFLEPEVAQSQMRSLGGMIIGQSPTIVPLDRKLYSLRDVTATVESIPLITASILSKKLAEGIHGLVMDVKFGSGAFLKDEKQARALGQTLKEVGKECGLNVEVVLTSMDNPLGEFAGNALEVWECLQVMRGKGPTDTRELSLALAEAMIRLDPRKTQDPNLLSRLERYLDSGRAFEVFGDMVAAQGGNKAFLENKDNFFKAPILRPVLAPSAGVVSEIDVRTLGVAIQTLGGGRRQVTDKIDHSVGLGGFKKVGDAVAAGEPLAFVHAQSEERFDLAHDLVLSAYDLSEKSAKLQLIVDTF